MDKTKEERRKQWIESTRAAVEIAEASANEKLKLLWELTLSESAKK